MITLLPLTCFTDFTIIIFYAAGTPVWPLRDFIKLYCYSLLYTGSKALKLIQHFIPSNLQSSHSPKKTSLPSSLIVDPEARLVISTSQH